jgi:acyl carrier protein
VDGIFHAAGVANLKYIEELDFETAEEEFEPKVYGTLYLKNALRTLTPAQSPDFVMMFSSMAAVLGGYGMGAYGGANAFMDSLALAQSGSYNPCWLSVNFDDWAFEYGKEQTEGYSHSAEKKLAMTPKDGIEAMERILAVGYDYPQILVATSPVEGRVQKWYNVGHQLNGVSTSIKPTLPSKPGKQISEAEKTDSREQDPSPEAKPTPRVTFEEKNNDDISFKITEIYKDVLGVTEMTPSDDFFDMGGDSLLAAQLLLQFQRKIPSVKIHLRDIFLYPTLGAFVEYCKAKG